MSGDELRGLAEEQGALRRVATLVARGAAPGEVFAAVTEEVGRRLPVDFALMGRYEADAAVTAIAAWGTPVADFPVGRTLAGDAGFRQDQRGVGPGVPAALAGQ